MLVQIPRKRGTNILIHVQSVIDQIISRGVLEMDMEAQSG